MMFFRTIQRNRDFIVETMSVKGRVVQTNLSRPYKDDIYIHMSNEVNDPSPCMGVSRVLTIDCGDDRIGSAHSLLNDVVIGMFLPLAYTEKSMLFRSMIDKLSSMDLSLMEPVDDSLIDRIEGMADRFQQSVMKCDSGCSRIAE